MPRATRPDDKRLRKHEPNRKRGRKAITPPSQNAHWLCHFLFLHIKLENVTLAEVYRVSGYDRKSFVRWWKGELSPRIDQVEDCLSVFGYMLKAVPKAELATRYDSPIEPEAEKGNTPKRARPPLSG